MNRVDLRGRISRAAPLPTSVIILNDFGWVNGGQSKVAIDSAIDLADCGVDVCFIAGRGPLDERLVSRGIHCEVVGDHDLLSDPNRLRASASGLWNRAARRALDDALDRCDPASTLIHVHGWAKSLSPSIGPAVTSAGFAHVYTLHEYFLACPNGGFYDYRAGAICTRLALGASCLSTNCDVRSMSHKIWRVARQAVLWNLGQMPGSLREIIYLSPRQRKIMDPYINPAARWHYLPNPTLDQPEHRVLAEDNAPFLFVGRLSPEKGGLVAAKAARLAKVPIVFCGDGEERAAIERANPDATMLGWVDAAAVKSWFGKARCLLFPSLWYETYGLVVADALRLGVPPLVSSSSVAADLVDPGQTGDWVARGNVDAWADAMRRMQCDDRVSKLSAAAFEAGRRLLGRNDYIDRLAAIYAMALSRHREGRQVAERAS